MTGATAWPNCLGIGAAQHSTAMNYNLCLSFSRRPRAAQIANECLVQTAHRDSLAPAAEGRTARHRVLDHRGGDLHGTNVFERLTFDMSGRRKHAKRAYGCPLDGRVRHRSSLRDELDVKR